MSSLKNAAKAASKPHRERAQPAARQRLGLLEKHKDYAARARDYRQKQATLRALRRKAAARNDDEFAFGMMARPGPGSVLTRGRRAFTGTVDGDRGNRALGVEAVRLLKTQDMQYLRTMRTVAVKEVSQLEERLVLAGGGKEMEEAEEAEDGDEDDFGLEMPKKKKSQTATKARKIVFLDGVDERDQILQELEAHKQEEDYNQGSEDGRSTTTTNADQKLQSLAKLRRRLKTAKDKLQALTDAERELDVQRARMAKTATYGGITKSGKKIKIRERKR
ncbi:hypothetical protein P8C59_008011 [Phyllachora maydis]|uniref:U3 small nucleolar RNA-associated protein 11 n=1 Tax=Phyllachora maydis TaxID=1825666 RepID=A0AAD9I9M0_9PEZI|nr:hypothetical protein P8C59_008011 [Phyllachora maydis]